MAYVDKTLNCVDCSATFTFSAGEQEFFAGKGFTNKPKRCPDCRQANKQQRRGSDSGRIATAIGGKGKCMLSIRASCGKDN